MSKRVRTTTALTDISAAVQQMEEQLKAANVKAEHRVKAILSLEETLVRVSELTQGQDVRMQIAFCKGLRKSQIKISFKGAAVRTADLFPPTDNAGEIADMYGPEAEELIRDIVLRANARNLNCRYARGVNTISILVSKSEKTLLYDTLTALAIGVTAGILTRNLASPEMATWISGTMFLPLYQTFLTIITMIIGPFIFFSLAASIAGFQDMGSLGKTGGKVFGCYLMTTLMGVLLCMGLFYLIEPGEWGSMALPETAKEQELICISAAEKLFSIIPTNFIGSFVENDMLKIMFLAILIGATLGHTGKYAEMLKNAFEGLNELFARVTSILASLLPIAILGATANMAVTLDLQSLSALISWVGFSLLCVVLQFVLYLILINLVGRMNPLHYVRKFFPAMLTALMTSSSSVTIPISQECCRKLGVSSRIYSFSIPLGANINMDGTSLMFTGTALFLANLYGIHVDLPTLVSLGTTVMLISVALPGVPGAGTACLLLVFAIVGVPAEAFGMVIGLVPLLELVETSLNVAGDGAVTTIVARSEGAIDMKQYKE